MSSRKILTDNPNSTGELIADSAEAPAPATATPPATAMTSAPAPAPASLEKEAPARDALAGAFPDWDLLPPTTFVKRIVRKKTEPAQL